MPTLAEEILVFGHTITAEDAAAHLAAVPCSGPTDRQGMESRICSHVIILGGLSKLPGDAMNPANSCEGILY